MMDVDEIVMDDKIERLSRLIAEHDKRLNSKIIVFEKGAVDDVEKLRAELLRSDGPRLISINPGRRFEVLDV